MPPLIPSTQDAPSSCTDMVLSSPCSQNMEQKTPARPRAKHIDDLPPETLYDIFLSVVQSAFFEEYGSRLLYPRTLLNVCRRWKDVCSDYTPLWAYISLVGHSCHGVDRDEWDSSLVIDTLTQLERTQDLPLFVDAREVCTCACQVSRFRAMVAHSHRWEVVMIDIRENRLPFDTFQSLIPPEQGFSSLREIRWSAELDPTEYLNTLCLPFDCGKLVNLRSVKLTSLADIDGPRMWKFPWHQLTTLTLLYYIGGPGELLSMLSKCKNLEKLELDLASTDRVGMRSEIDALVGVWRKESISLPHLLSLTLPNPGEPDLMWILQYLHAPNLQHFDYGIIRAQSEAIFSKFLNPSYMSGTLTTLSITYPPEFKATAHAKTFALLRCMTHLTLRADGHDINCDEFLKLTTRDRGQYAVFKLLPRLEHFELQDIIFDPVLLTQMVESRVAGSISTVPFIVPHLEPRSSSLQSLKVVFRSNSIPRRIRYLQTVLEKCLEKLIQSKKLRLQF